MSVIGKLLVRVVVPDVILAVLVYLFFSIEPLKEYCWWQGIFHGSWVIPNWITSWVVEPYYVKALFHTTAYNVFWWISFVFSILYHLSEMIRAFRK